MSIAKLYWLPRQATTNEQLRKVATAEAVEWNELVKLAGEHLDFIQTNRLDKLLTKHFSDTNLRDAVSKPVRLAVLSSSTVDHLLPGMRVAGLRRGIFVSAATGDYGQYLQELGNPKSHIVEFSPTVMLFAFHAQHLLGNIAAVATAEDARTLVDNALSRIRNTWKLARERFKGLIIQQSILPVAPMLIGANEHRFPGSMAAMIDSLNAGLRNLADAEGVAMLSLDHVLRSDGLDAWHDSALWHRAKQEISPLAAPAYGDLVLRVIAAQIGRSAKCLVLDLDNTLWGGVIGDDGLEGIKLGQGSAVGEAFVAFQSFARDLARRGIILAVCSKNDEENARTPFLKHPDMVLKNEDIACFVANWSDKAGNLRYIAQQLNIGVDSLVFADDNPFERNIVRRELPMVAVPELPEDPSFYAKCLSDAGYFEALQVTKDDFERSGQYRTNAQRDLLKASHTDLAGYLRSLQMELRWAPFDHVGLQRIVQLINKTNQFNLTTRRYTEQEVLAVMEDPESFTLQLRLVDCFGDNGIIGIVIGKPQGSSILLDTWLMSCRVLGRQVEEATMNVVIEEAKRLRKETLIGEYLPSKKNNMVKEHYAKLKFGLFEEQPGGVTVWNLTTSEYEPFPTFISIVRTEND